MASCTSQPTRNYFASRCRRPDLGQLDGTLKCGQFLVVTERSTMQSVAVSQMKTSSMSSFFPPFDTAARLRRDRRQRGVREFRRGPPALARVRRDCLPRRAPSSHARPINRHSRRPPESDPLASGANRRRFPTSRSSGRRGRYPNKPQKVRIDTVR